MNALTALMFWFLALFGIQGSDCVNEIGFTGWQCNTEAPPPPPPEEQEPTAAPDIEGANSISNGF